MELMLDEIVKRCAAGEAVVLCVLVRTRGSTPQARGAKMLVMGDGRTIGTLGGGCVEAEVRTRALRQLHVGVDGKPMVADGTKGGRAAAAEQLKGAVARGEAVTASDGLAVNDHGAGHGAGHATVVGGCLMEFRLDQDYGWDDGLICGGIMDVHTQVIDRSSVGPFEVLLGKLRAGLSGELKLNYQTADGAKEYAETFGPPPRLVIVGAGHVGQALAALAGPLDFRVVVLDDRPDFASVERFPTASERRVGDIESELHGLAIDVDTYIVIVTRGHKNDARALAAVIESHAKYIGLIGSKRKIKAIFDELAVALGATAAGVPAAGETAAERLSRVHAPIGLEIGAVTPAEIALSIAAELIAVRRGRGDMEARPMKMGMGQVKGWVERAVVRDVERGVGRGAEA